MIMFVSLTSYMLKNSDSGIKVCVFLKIKKLFCLKNFFCQSLVGMFVSGAFSCFLLSFISEACQGLWDAQPVENPRYLANKTSSLSALHYPNQTEPRKSSHISSGCCYFLNCCCFIPKKYIKYIKIIKHPRFSLYFCLLLCWYFSYGMT